MTKNKLTGERFNVWDIDGTTFLEDHKKGSYHIGETENVDVDCLNEIADRLNKLTTENEKIKQTIKEAYANERTMIGQSVLKQLLDSLE